MAYRNSLASTVVLAAFWPRTAVAQDVAGTCVSYGMDFQNGGSYFQNSLSSEGFSFVTQFDGCNDDVAFNLLIDPNGNQTLCSNTKLKPDDTDMMSTCPITKSQLFSGDWSVLIISNNGGDSVAYERDFDLSVGPQSTSTVTPTVTATLVSTPLDTTTTTTTDTSTALLEAKTVTSASVTITQTKTFTPARATTTTTKPLLTLKFTKFTVEVSKVTATKTASCQQPHRQHTHDPIARIRPTVGPLAKLFNRHSRREIKDFETEKHNFVQARAARLSARAPDPQPLIVTNTNVDQWPTVTSTSIGATLTATITTEVQTTVTSTPPPVTVMKGEATAPVVTITAARPTKTVTKHGLITTSITTKTAHIVYTITRTTTPAAVASACKMAGGVLH
ncbi:hypothetical protein BDV95DRAFT_617019 [Massariosphaeria phaeospora]|uniref:Uncharacterized protein n=1 Tax=Massariosphaeria phaeospora TaxID=100035 RepID=A0A7C8IHT6_9PLEO|nr:hypothetical protein BDV95DRAFT_617019 [Massariosphaeria phaeospora]